MIRPPHLALLPVLLAGCVHTVTVSQVTPELPAALVSIPTRAWEVRERRDPVADAPEGPEAQAPDPALVGFVLRFDPSSGDHGAFHSVRNVWNQELGLVDGDGRAWRYRPHGDDPLWLGTGTVAEGVFAILGLDPERSELAETALEAIAGR